MQHFNYFFGENNIIYARLVCKTSDDSSFSKTKSDRTKNASHHTPLQSLHSFYLKNAISERDETLRTGGILILLKNAWQIFCNYDRGGAREPPEP